METDEEEEAGKKRDTGVRESLKETFQTFAGDETDSSPICGHDCSKERDVPYLICCSLDGVFGALYRLGDMLKTGLRARLYDIPIDQVTIELCDYMDINPYEADTKGAFLIASDSHGRMLKELKEKGIPAKLIGYTARDNSRIVLGPTERYLTK